MLSRLEARRKQWADEEEGRDEDDYAPDMPPLEAPRYLLDYLFEVGPTMSGAMGAGPITHEELRAWCELTSSTLAPWEARIIRRLSIAYLNEQNNAGKRNCPPPWKPDDAKPEVSDTQAALRKLANL